MAVLSSSVLVSCASSSDASVLGVLVVMNVA